MDVTKPALKMIGDQVNRAGWALNYTLAVNISFGSDPDSGKIDKLKMHTVHTGVGVGPAAALGQDSPDKFFVPIPPQKRTPTLAMFLQGLSPAEYLRFMDAIQLNGHETIYSMSAKPKARRKQHRK